jgi:hypothetical protein
MRGSPAPSDERPRRWQYPVGVLLIALIAALAALLRGC